MGTDISKIRELSNLDSAKFREMIELAATAAGLSPSQAKSAAANSEMFRAILRGASDRDLQKIAGKLSDEKADEIMSKFK